MKAEEAQAQRAGLVFSPLTAMKGSLFIVAADWRGPQGMGDPARTGVVLTVQAPAPAAARG